MFLRFFPILLCLSFGACGPAANSSAAAGDTTAADSTADDAATAADATADATAKPDSTLPVDAAADTAAGTCAATPPPCTDNQILDMQLFKKASTRPIENAPDGDGFASHVDSTGGGFTPTESYVYAKFTKTGLVAVAVGDEAALDSMDWDIALRRYVVRLNSGVSGPSCVTLQSSAAPDFDGLKKAEADGKLQGETYYDAKCQLKKDAYDLSLGTLLSPFWKYKNCVQMTGKVFVLKLASGAYVKIVFSSYYELGPQATCDSTGSVPQGTAGGQLRFRWAYLPQ